MEVLQARIKKINLPAIRYPGPIHNHSGKPILTQNGW